MTEQAEEESWIFDSLVCFLNGPIWDAPLQSFIEEKSLIFEPNIEAANEEYVRIFDEYKNLVDFMLGNFMEDLGITSDQFEIACAKGTVDGITLQFQQNNFEQIWAANDFEMFVRMMAQRNVELQLQALELIEQKYGITPDSFKPYKSNTASEQETSTSVLETVQADINPLQSSKLFEREVLQEISKQFAAGSNDDEEKLILEEKDVLEKSLREDIAFLENKHPMKISDTKTEEENKEIDIEVTRDTTTPLTKSESVLPESKYEMTYNKNVTGPELQKRQDYLRAQRDKLVALKKEARRKHLDSNESLIEDKDSTHDSVKNVAPGKSTKALRPKSARAAKKILEQGMDQIEPQQMEIRKALVAKLKNQVVVHKTQ